MSDRTSTPGLSMRQVALTPLALDVSRAEGPVLRQNGDIAFVSMGHGRVYKVGATTKADVICETGGTPNGLAEDRDGRLFVAQPGERPVVSTSPLEGGIQVIAPDGSWTWLTRDPISPNDVAFGPDGFLYVTDPTRMQSRPSRDDGRIWRCDVKTGVAELLASVPWFPNGIAFGPEDDSFYVVSTFEQRVVRFPLRGGALGTPETAVALPVGHADGIGFDIEGNMLVTTVGSPSTVQVWSPAGKMLDIFTGDRDARFSNVALGDDRRLILTDLGGGAVYAVPDWPTAGLALHPFR